MSHTHHTVVETGTHDDGTVMVHVDAWGPAEGVSMSTAEASGHVNAVITTGKTSAEVEAVRAAIVQRIADGEGTPVLASHLDDLGLRAAVLAWAQEA